MTPADLAAVRNIQHMIDSVALYVEEPVRASGVALAETIAEQRLRFCNLAATRQELAALLAEIARLLKPRDGPLLSCPWCGESQIGRVVGAQVDHLISCGDRLRAQPSGAEAMREALKVEHEMTAPEHAPHRDADKCPICAIIVSPPVEGAR